MGELLTDAVDTIARAEAVQTDRWLAMLEIEETIRLAGQLFQFGEITREAFFAEQSRLLAEWRLTNEEHQVARECVRITAGLLDRLVAL